jgi:hypothetical protein
MSSDFINDDVKGQIMALEARENALRVHFRRLAPVAAGVSVAACAAFTAAHFMGPVLHPTTVDIPSFLLNKFSDWVPSSGGSSDYGKGGIADMTSGVTSLVSTVTSFFIPAAAVIGIIGAGLNALRGDVGGAARSLGAVAIIGGALFVTSSMFGVGPLSGSDEPSQRELFVKAVDHSDYATTRSLLGRVMKEDSVSGRYVLAQVLLVKPKQSVVTDTIDLNADLASSIVTSQEFKPDPAALYAIEHTVFGNAKTAAAVSYEDSRLARQSWAKSIGLLLAVLGIISFGAGVTLAAARLVIARRLNRIHELLGYKRK